MKANQILVNYGDQAKEMVKEILKEIKIEDEINKRELIALKPNLIKASKSKDGATTDPKIVEGIIEYLHEKGFENLIVMEGSWVGADTQHVFKYCGYENLSQKYEVPLYNLQNDNYVTKKYKDMEIELAETALKADYIINLPVLKGHCQTTITCALKNLKGCISNSEKRKFHRQGLHKPIAYLNKLLKQDLIIVDGIYGKLDFEEGGNPVKMNRIIAGQDPVLIDSYAAELLGYSHEEIDYIKIANQIGRGEKDLKKAEIIELNKDQAKDINYTSYKLTKLTEKIEAEDVCSSCYGSLIHALKRIDEKGQLNEISDSIKIGQGYQEQKIKGIGIGNCCIKAEKNIKGCPPSAHEIYKFLKRNI